LSTMIIALALVTFALFGKFLGQKDRF
jgi:hypothetical protein